VDVNKATIEHIAENDSGSGGNVADGDFYASETDITSLQELRERIAKEAHPYMNEVNMGFKQDAVLGLFTAIPHTAR